MRQVVQVHVVLQEAQDWAGASASPAPAQCWPSDMEPVRDTEPCLHHCPKVRGHHSETVRALVSAV